MRARVAYWPLVARSHPGYFGKVGMRHFHYTANKYHCPSLNVERIWHVAGEKTLAAAKAAPKGKAPLIDVTQLVRGPRPRARRGLRFW